MSVVVDLGTFSCCQKTCESWKTLNKNVAVYLIGSVFELGAVSDMRSDIIFPALLTTYMIAMKHSGVSLRLYRVMVDWGLF